MNFANTNQPITTFPLTALKSLGHQQPAPTPQKEEAMQQPDLMEAITTILDSSTWFEEKLNKRLEEITQELKDDLEELVQHAVDDAVDTAIRELDINDHIDLRDAVKQAVCEELNDTLTEEVNNLLENASFSISV
jgi:2-oxo-4-hydroxy-4-carboxy--5-ureidoimidazoline (OHCU) decarboxylase